MLVVRAVVVYVALELGSVIPARPMHAIWVKEKKSKLVLIGIHDHSLSTSDVSVPSID